MKCIAQPLCFMVDDFKIVGKNAAKIRIIYVIIR